MDIRRRKLTAVPKSSKLDPATVVTALVVVLCLTLHGVGASVLFSTLARAGFEESQEESECEVKVREISHRSHRPRLVSLGKEYSFRSRASLDDAFFHRPRPVISPLATHLIGAGIVIRC
jgi:hypothetical protein